MFLSYDHLFFYNNLIIPSFLELELIIPAASLKDFPTVLDKVMYCLSAFTATKFSNIQFFVNVIEFNLSLSNP